MSPPQGQLELPTVDRCGKDVHPLIFLHHRLRRWTPSAPGGGQSEAHHVGTEVGLREGGIALVVEGQVDPYLIPLLVRMGTGGPVEADLDRSVEV